MTFEPRGRCFQGHVLEGYEKREFERTGLCEQCVTLRKLGYPPETRGELAAEYRRRMQDTDPAEEHLPEVWS